MIDSVILDDEDIEIAPALARRVAAALEAEIARLFYAPFEPQPTSRTFLVSDPDRRDTLFCVTVKDLS